MPRISCIEKTEMEVLYYYILMYIRKMLQQ